MRPLVGKSATSTVESYTANLDQTQFTTKETCGPEGDEIEQTHTYNYLEIQIGKDNQINKISGRIELSLIAFGTP